MEKVSAVLKKKGSQVWSVTPNDTVYHALEIMADKGIGALLVIKDNSLKGIFTERDYARKVILKGKSSRELLVNDIMSNEVFCVDTESTMEEVMALMTNKKIRHVPILEEGALLGIISIGDVVKSIISSKEKEIMELKRYIMGS